MTYVLTKRLGRRSTVETRLHSTSDQAQPRTATPHAIGGNHAILRKLEAGRLKVSQPGDKYEQEAERMADRVMRMSDGQAAAQNAGFEHNKPGLGNNRGSSGLVPSVGQPLSKTTRGFFEPRLGQDFSGVRVHKDGWASESTKAISARAYTTGQDIVFSRGEYAPRTGEGKRLLAHELTHVIQQTAGAKIRRPPGGIVQRNGDRPTISELRARTVEELFELWVTHNYQHANVPAPAPAREHLKYLIRSKLGTKGPETLEWFLDNEPNVNHANGFWLREAIRYRLRDERETVSALTPEFPERVPNFAPGDSISDWIASVINYFIGLINDEVQAERLREDLEQSETTIMNLRRENPDVAILVTFYFLRSTNIPHAGIKPGFRYRYLTINQGSTISEARADRAAQGFVREAPSGPGGRPRREVLSQQRIGEQWMTLESWVEPRRAISTASLRRPFAAIEGQGFFVTGRAILQDVKFTIHQRFDDEGQSIAPVNGGSVGSLRFYVLEPPRTLIAFVAGSGGPLDIPVTDSSTPSGARIPVVQLDTVLGDVTAAMVFPANDATENAFASVPATADPDQALPRMTNFDKVRWIRPEHIGLMRP